MVFDSALKKKNSLCEFKEPIAIKRQFHTLTPNACYSSMEELQRSNATFELNAKRLNFNNINDIKIEMDLLKVENDENKSDSRTMPGFDKSDNILYNDTTIKKVNIDKKHINIEDFLENIKKEANDFETEESHFVDDFADNPGDSNEEDVPLLKRIGKTKSRNKRNKKKHKEDSDDEYSPGPLDEGDEEYVPVPKKTNIKLNNTEKRVGRPRKFAEGEKERKFVNVLIKPKILREIVTLPSKRRKKPKPDSESKQKKFQLCPHCGKQMKSLKSHLLLHIGERKFTCDQCTKSYFNEKDLNTHMIKHGSKNYKCDQCIADFHTPDSLRSHKLSHSQEKKFVCNICNKAFRRVRVMQIHRKQHNIANKNFKCDLCNMSFFSKSHLNHHMRIHTGERPFNCEKYFLQRHHMIHNLASKTIKCEFCNMTFYTNANLRHHLRIHTGERPFNCERHIMRRHYNAHSLANKNIKCDQCNMTFFTKSNLNHHIRIHTGERPFNCELCSQPYSYKHDFNRHCLKKHGIFLKRRKVYIMNEEVLAREREMMKEVVRRAQGNLKEGESINPFEAEGPGSHLAFIQIMKALENKQIQVPADVSY